MAMTGVFGALEVGLKEQGAGRTAEGFEEPLLAGTTDRGSSHT